MWLVVLKPFSWHEVKECKTKEEGEQWRDERIRQLRRSYPNGDFPCVFYEINQVVRVCGSA